MKSRTELWHCMLQDCGIRCSVSTPVLDRDLETVKSRVQHEGDSFFTVTLPQFGKDFEQVLRNGEIDDSLFVGWSRSGTSKKRNKTPKFLGGLFDRVVDSGTGRMLADPCVDSIQSIRQLTLAFGKLKELCGDVEIERELDHYIATDEELHKHLVFLWDESGLPFLTILENLRQVFRVCFGTALVELDRKIYQFDVVPGHGPGATADRLFGNEKFDQKVWPERLEQLFPFMEYAVPSRDPVFLQDVQFLPSDQEIPVKVTPVPKTAKRPRLIAEEPTAMQYMQQAVSRSLVRLLESPIKGNPASFLVGFSDQWPNQAMAAVGSEDGSLATLDLSEASDRVPNWLVEEIFQDFPWVNEALQVTRSTKANLGSKGIIPLSKFASMGSALTFPVEAMIFAAVAVKTVAHGSLADIRPVSRAEVESMRDSVRVYGDDIIVPTDSAEAVVSGLETLGFKVNQSKSFWTGKFRESCGKEYFAGNDVSIVRFRKDVPTRPPLPRRDATDIISTVATRNQFFEAGYEIVTRCLDDILERVLNPYPFVARESPVLGRFSKDGSYDVTAIDEDTQSPLVRGYVVDARVPKNAALEYAALLKCLLQNGDANSAEDHLDRSGRPRVVSIKRAMARPY